MLEGGHGFYSTVEIQWLATGLVDGQYRENHRRGNALFLVDGAIATLDKVEGVFHLIGIDALAQLGGGLVQQFTQIQGQFIFNNDAQHAEGGATQRVGVLGTAGFLADTEDAHQGIDLVGQGNRHAGFALRQGVAGKARQVLLIQGLGHVVWLAFALGQVEAHDALHGVELADHFAVQIGLAEFAGQLGVVCVTTDLPGNHGGQAADALALVGHGAQLLLEYHIGQPFSVLGQGAFAIVVVEESGIGQAWADNLLVAVDHLLGILGLDIADGNKARHQLAVSIQHREVFLVLFHSTDQGFLGYAKEVVIEAAHQRFGPFHQSGDLVEQVRIDLGDTACLFTSRQGLLFDHGFTAIKVSEDVAVLFDALGILASGRQVDSARSMETVAIAGAAGLQIQQLEGNHLVTKQRHQPVGRAHKLHLAFAPAHTLGDWQFLDGLGEKGRNQFGGAFPLLGNLRHQALALAGVLTAQLVHGEAQ